MINHKWEWKYKCSECGCSEFYVKEEDCLKCTNCDEYYFVDFCNIHGLDDSEIFPN